MTIECKICTKIFSKQITNSHLKTHNISMIEYKRLYGDLSSQQYKNELSTNRMGEKNSNYGNKWDDNQKNNLSTKNKNKIPWNKNKTIEYTDKMKEAIQNREKKYETGELKRNYGRVITENQKENISKKLKSYAINNTDKLKERAIKAVETKKQNGFDFGSVMRGKNHSEVTKNLISQKSKESNILKTEIAFEQRLNYIHKANLVLISEENRLLTLKCNQCNHVFTLTRQCFTKSKFREDWCQVCHPLEINYRSKNEIELFDFIKQLSNDSVNSNRQILKKKELDIYIPTKKIAIEFNGLYWHSEDILERQGKSKFSDYEKMNQLKKFDIRYIGIFEDEWIYKKEIVKSRLKNILNCTDKIIYARKCNIQEITSKQASLFCEQNHIQGRGRSNARYGLFYNDELVSVMTFSKDNLSRKIIGWEINRFCNKLNTTVVGGASKLFSHFIKIHDPLEVISYADSRWSEGNLYKQLNFKFCSTTKPNYWYFLPNELQRIHRFTLRKNKNDVAELSEKEIRSTQGFMKIYDCGNTKWIWKKGH